MNNVAQQIAHRDFSSKTIRTLSKKGVEILSTQLIPGDGDMPMANATRGYVVNDNGCGRVLTFKQVTEMAA